MHNKNYLAVKHARLTRRRGMGRAQVAVGHSILVAAYWMLTRDEPYHDLGADWHERRTTKPKPDGWSPNSNASDTP
jgi:transposase